MVQSTVPCQQLLGTMEEEISVKPSVRAQMEQTRWKRNNIVLLKDDSAPHNQWTMAKITDVYPGKDGQARSIRLLITQLWMLEENAP